MHFKEYEFKQQSTKKCTSALLKCPINKSGAYGPWAVEYIHASMKIEVILVTYFNSNPALTPLQKRPIQLAKMPPDSYTWEGLRRPSSDPTHGLSSA